MRIVLKKVYICFWSRHPLFWQYIEKLVLANTYIPGDEMQNSIGIAVGNVEAFTTRPDGLQPGRNRSPSKRRFYASWGRFCDLPDLGAIQFPGGGGCPAG